MLKCINMSKTSFITSLANVIPMSFYGFTPKLLSLARCLVLVLADASNSDMPCLKRDTPPQKSSSTSHRQPFQLSSYTHYLILNIQFNCNVQWVHGHKLMAHSFVVNKEEGHRIKRVAANVLNKHVRTADKE